MRVRSSVYQRLTALLLTLVCLFSSANVAGSLFSMAEEVLYEGGFYAAPTLDADTGRLYLQFNEEPAIGVTAGETWTVTCNGTALSATVNPYENDGWLSDLEFLMDASYFTAGSDYTFRISFRSGALVGYYVTFTVTAEGMPAPSVKPLTLKENASGFQNRETDEHPSGVVTELSLSLGEGSEGIPDAFTLYNEREQFTFELLLTETAEDGGEKTYSTYVKPASLGGDAQEQLRFWITEDGYAVPTLTPLLGASYAVTLTVYSGTTPLYKGSVSNLSCGIVPLKNGVNLYDPPRTSALPLSVSRAAAVRFPDFVRVDGEDFYRLSLCLAGDGLTKDFLLNPETVCHLSLDETTFSEVTVLHAEEAENGNGFFVTFSVSDFTPGRGAYYSAVIRLYDGESASDTLPLYEGGVDELSADRRFEITFSVDGVLTKQTVLEGDMPTFHGSPIKEADERYAYTFTGWDSEILPASADAVYTALFAAKRLTTEVYGDVSGDKKLTIFDVTALLIYQKDPSSIRVVEDYCDVNADGVCDALDVKVLLNFLSATIT